MVTTFPARAGSHARRSFPVRFLEKYFYFSMSLLIAAVVVYGFSQTVGDNLFHPAIRRPLLLSIHGACFSAWVLFFIFQSALVRTRNVRLHKRTGWFGAGLAALMIPLGLTIAVVMGRFDVHVLHQQDEVPFFLVPLFDIVAFTSTIVPAILLRRKPELHRRFILIATCILTSAAFGRFPTNFFPPAYFYSGVDALILLGALRDLVVNRRIHKVYLYALPLLFAAQSAVMWIVHHSWAPWMRISQAILG
jgi:hypothetical protein